ncbi:MAG: MFS transporter [Thermogemmatispora sp.]|uniref:MFS transporter n=1 Tax=Thermogemmatispora aurantia TaxID=2045279 RepID=A0A5J4KHK0_9CHLR|nr:MULTISPECIES: MFS transporter [Thermogemmatispora]MBE3566218.1 MFS transporter [Thermogemmatispora sp.]GER85681.1 MFS transporter [Thermogemmatispora aurantia]
MSLDSQQPATPRTAAQSAGEAPPVGLLRNRNFLFLTGGQIISYLGDFIYSTTLQIWAYTLVPNAASVSGIWAAQYLPYVLVGPIAGVFVDRWNRRRIMIVSDLLRCFIALWPLLVPPALRLPAIYLAVFLIGSLGRFFSPARSGVMQVILAEQDQPRAASILQSSFAFAVVAGPSLGAGLYFLVGPYLGTILNALSFLVSALCILAMHVSAQALQPGAQRRAEAAAGEGRTGAVRAVLTELVDGFRFVLGSRVLGVVMLLLVINWFGVGALNALDIVFISQRLHVSPELYGPMATGSGVGLLIGSLIAGVLSKKLSPRSLLTGSVFLTGLGIVVFGFQVWFPLALFFYCLTGLLQGGIEVGYMALVLISSPRTLIGRVEAVIQTSMFIASVLSIALGGYLAQFIPVYILFIVGGWLTVLAGLIGWFGLPARIEPVAASPASTEAGPEQPAQA